MYFIFMRLEHTALPLLSTCGMSHCDLSHRVAATTVTTTTTTTSCYWAAVNVAGDFARPPLVTLNVSAACVSVSWAAENGVFSRLACVAAGPK